MSSKVMCVGERGMCGVMFVRTNLSSILRGLHSREMGLQEAGSVGDLFGFKKVMILPIFQILGIVLCNIEWLNMSVRTVMATGPRCFKCR